MGHSGLFFQLQLPKRSRHHSLVGDTTAMWLLLCTKWTVASAMSSGGMCREHPGRCRRIIRHHKERITFRLRTSEVMDPRVPLHARVLSISRFQKRALRASL
jgi:hypothetical protein